MKPRASSGWYLAFAHREEWLAAVRGLRAAGVGRFETFSAAPIEGWDEALGEPAVAHGYARNALLGALFGLVAGAFMQVYASAWAAPLNIGGRPLNSWPAFIPVSFILMILCSALSVVGTLFYRLRLPWLAHPVFHVPGFSLAQGEYGILLYADDATSAIGERRARFAAAATRVEEWSC